MRKSLLFRSRFWRNQRGAVSMIFMIGTVGIFVAMLSGIDYMRWVAVESRAQAALDAAVLAAGRNLGNLTTNPTQAQLDAWKADARGYFSANWPSDYLGSSIDTGSLSIDVVSTPASGNTPAGQTISMKLTGSMPLMVSGYLGSVPLAVGASNEALRVAKNNLEVVLVLDNTGSMNDPANGSYGSSKLSALKSAAKTLISTLTPTTTSGASVYFGLVPFTTTVNVRDATGALPTKWLQTLSVNGTALPATAPFTTSNWSGCLAEPALSNPLSLQNPGAQPFHAYFDGWDVTSPNWYANYWSYSNFRQTYCTQQPTTFLTTDTKKLNTAIDNMVGNGSTFIASGVLWGWRMLAPSWRNADTSRGWGSPTLPQDSSSYLTKAMIIISDGDNVWQLPTSGFSAPTMAGVRYSNGSYTASSNVMGYPNYAYGWGYGGYGWYPVNGETGFNGDFQSNLQPFGTVKYVYGDSSSVSIVDAIQINACKQAAAAGVKIWTIVYGKDGNTAHGLSVMQQCATQAAYYAPTDADLAKYFQSIAGQLSTLRLTK